MATTKRSTRSAKPKVEVSEDTVDALFPPHLSRLEARISLAEGVEPTYSDILESICGVADDSQPVEQYDGTLGVTTAYVNAHQKQAVQVQWNTGLGSIFTRPGDVDGARWGSATLISPDLVLTCGHLFDQTADGWTLPRQNGSTQVITPQQIATNMHINVLYQVDPAGVLRTEVSFPITQLVEYRLGGLDMAIVRVGGNPGSTYGFTAVSPTNASVGDMLAIIGHPAGHPKRIEAGPATVVNTNRIEYNDIDTLGGNSGSGILGPTGELVGVHTNGGCNAAGTGSNFGTAIAGIRAVSPTLQALPHGAQTATADDILTPHTIFADDLTRLAADATRKALDSQTAADLLNTGGGLDTRLGADTQFWRDLTVYAADTNVNLDNPIGTNVAFDNGTNFAGDVGTGIADTLRENIIDPGSLIDPVINPAIFNTFVGGRPFVQAGESVVDTEGDVDIIGQLLQAVAEARATLEAVEAILTQLRGGEL